MVWRFAKKSVLCLLAHVSTYSKNAKFDTHAQDGEINRGREKEGHCEPSEHHSALQSTRSTHTHMSTTSGKVTSFFIPFGVDDSSISASGPAGSTTTSSPAARHRNGVCTYSRRRKVMDVENTISKGSSTSVRTSFSTCDGGLAPAQRYSLCCSALHRLGIGVAAMPCDAYGLGAPHC